MPASITAVERDRYRRRLADLVKICEATVWSTCPQVTSQRVVGTLIEIFGCDIVQYHLLDVMGEKFTLCPSDVLTVEPPPDEFPLSITTGRMPTLMRDRRPIVMDFRQPHPNDLRHESEELHLLGYKGAVSVPLLAGDGVLGIFSIVYTRERQWSVEDLDFLLDIGRVLGVSVQHALTARKATDLEILRERKNLSAELHDNLSQMIGSLILGAEAALLSLEEGNPDRVRRDIERIRLAGQEAERVLREEMLSLRTPLNETEGLIPDVRECLQRFEQQWGIATALQVEQSSEGLVVSMQTKLQFMRILHESLSNVLRHATASHVNVVLKWDHHWLSMLIHDDGRGFEPRSVPSGHLGLRIMRERAESLGGELSIESGRESGTSVRVDVPRFAH